MSANDTVATDGTYLDLDGAPTTFNYNADGTVNYIEVSQYNAIYRQTFTYSSGKVSTISAWIKQ